MDGGCTIPGNPDVSGIGVRTAIYIQNLLCFLPALWALWDGQVTQDELDSAETQTTTNLVLAFAILISSIVQACTLGLSNYHASIVLSMSWMNNTNAFIYFLLYIQHKRGHVESNWAAWYAHVRGKFGFLLPRRGRQNTNASASEAGGSDNAHSSAEALNASGRAGVKILTKRVVILLGSLHLTLMAALGIWLWSNLIFFGTRRAIQANKCAESSAFIAIVGRGVPMRSKALRTCSLILYALFLIPGLNLVLPVVLFLSLYFRFHRRYPVGVKDGKPASGKRAALPVFIGLAVLLAVNIIFIVDIESTLIRNKGLQREGEEAKWGFGQILAILLLFMPLRDLIETLLARRTKRRRREVAAELKGAIDAQEIDAVLRALERGADLKKVLDMEEKPEDAAQWILKAAVLKCYLSIVETLLHYPAININFTYEEGSTVLMLACDRTEMGIEGENIVQALLQCPDVDTNIVDNSGETALMKGCLQGNGPAVRLLVKHQTTNVNIQDEDRDTALMRAAREGHASCTMALLEHPDIDTNKATQSGQTALIMAAYHGFEPVVRQLLNHQTTDVNRQDECGSTALIYASRSGPVDCAMVLLEHPGIDPSIANKEGVTALMEAARSESGEPVVCELLKHRTIGVNSKNVLGNTALIEASWDGRTSATMLLEHLDIDTNIANRSGRTALMVASLRGHEHLVQQLLKHPTTDVNLQDQSGRTALTDALRSGNAEIAMILLGHPDTKPSTIDTTNRTFERGWTLLMVLCSGGHESLARRLLEHPIPGVNVQDNFGETALLLALVSEHLSIAMALLSLQPDIDPNLASVYHGRTALMEASQRGLQAVVKSLLELQITDVNQRDTYGRTALIITCEAGQHEVASLLLHHQSIEPNLVDSMGQTALMKASLEGKESTVRCLCDHPITNINLQDHLGYTALMLAADHGHANIVSILLSRSDIEANLRSEDGRTAVELARERGHELLAQLFHISEVEI